MKRLVLAAGLLLLSGAGQAWGSGGEDGKIDAIGHVADGQLLELPWGHIVLPTLHIAGFELPITRHTVMLWLAALILIGLFSLARSGAGVVPRGLYNLLESLVVFIRDEVAISSIGKEHGPAFVPYLVTVFFFILTMNLIGLVPFGATATANLNVTATLAICTFLLMLGSGMKAHGIIGYWKHLVPHGVPLWLWPVMFLVEIMGLLAKPFALTVRLFANMLAGHMVILSLLGLIFSFAAAYGAIGGWGVAPVSVGFSLFVYLLELLVAFIQAYIFTFLTALFIGMSVHAH